MKTSLRSLALLFLLSTSSAFAGTTYYSQVLQPEGVATVRLKHGEVLTVISFTSDGSSAGDGTPGTVTADEVTPAVGDGSRVDNAATVLLSYDQGNVNDQPHTVVIAGILSVANGPYMEVRINASTTVATFVTYSVTTE